MLGQHKFNKCIEMDENKVESGNIPEDKNMLNTSKRFGELWTWELIAWNILALLIFCDFSSASAWMSDSDKASDSNIEFIKTGWETMMTLCSLSV